jgi:O-antigen/teichoic acid export membrane protein
MTPAHVRPPEMHRPILQRAGWGVADQALSSLTNFALGVLVVRSATAAGFGAFSVVFATFTVALGLSRALTSEPLTVRHSASTVSDWRRGVADATGVALATGVTLGLACILAGGILGDKLAAPLLALGVMLPGLLLQDCWRYAFFANGDGRTAFINDALYAAVLVVAFGALLTVKRASVAALILAWGGAATIAAIAGALQSRVLPAPRRSRKWGRQHSDLIPRYVGEFVASSGGSQLSVYGVGMLAGLGTLGSLRAAYVMFGPLQVLFVGVGLVAVPELVRFRHRSPRQLRLASAGLSLLLAALALAWGTAVTLMPAWAGRGILGSVWSTAHPLAAALTLGWIASAVIAGAAAAIRALGASKRGLTVRVAGSLLGVGGALAGVTLDGARGAAWGLALAACAESTLWWAQLRQALREIETRPAVAAPDPASLVMRPRAVAEKC